MQNYVNIILSSKGGVGKTFVACYLFEFLTALKKQQTILIDTDTSNQYLRNTAYYKAQDVDFKDKSGVITPKNVVQIAERWGKNNLVIDVGANSYWPWIKYLSEMDGIDDLETFGSKVLLHVILIGGIQFKETLACLKEVVNLNLNCDIVVHINNGYAEDDSNLLPKAEDLLAREEFNDIRDKLKYVVELPRCIVTNRELVDELKKNNIALTQMTDATSADKKKLIPILGTADRVDIFQGRAIRYRKKIFEALEKLNPLYDIE